jgi:hypothetical protein
MMLNAVLVGPREKEQGGGRLWVRTVNEVCVLGG